VDCINLAQHRVPDVRRCQQGSEHSDSGKIEATFIFVQYRQIMAETFRVYRVSHEKVARVRSIA